jgi:Zn finger protein HypA/HybF involved in hydrogenase expression
MFLAANPDKGRTAEEKEELKKKYTPGEDVLPKVEEREKTLRERMVEQEDRRLMNEIRDLSLQEVGVESSEARRIRRRREDGRLQSSSVPRRPRDDDSRDGRDAEGRDRRRRAEGEVDGERRRRRDQGDPSTTLRPEAASNEDRRRRRSQEAAASRRHEETTRTAARNLEHQSSLRSLISSSDVDSHEMEEEILRQIQEEGLLDGIDLDNIDVSQEDQISERIAEAYRRRQRERSRTEPSRRSDATARRPGHLSRSGSVDNSGNSGNEGLRVSSRHRTYSRASSATGQAEENTTSYPPNSSSNPHNSSSHLEVQPGGERRRRRRRTTSGGRTSSRSSTSPIPVSTTETARPAARSSTDLGDRPRSSHTQSSRPLVSANGRSTTDPLSSRSTESPPVELPATQSPQQISSPTFPSREERTQTQAEAPVLPVELPAQVVKARPVPPPLPARAAPAVPAELPTPASSTRASPPGPIFVPASVPSTLSPSTIQASDANQHSSLWPEPLSPRSPRSPRHAHSPSTASERATALQSAARPTSSGSIGTRANLPRFPEPSLTCSRCARPHIEYELHYNCSKCNSGDWNICLNCYRSGQGCEYWFGFGYAAWAKWEKQKAAGQLPPDAERPHLLTANRYIPPKTPPGGADGRRTLTTEDPEKRLQSGAFCSNCLAWANECYWRCDLCNDNDWGFCNSCVNQGRCCTHPLLPLIYKPDRSDTPPMSPTHDQQTPTSAAILTGPGVVEFGPFKPLTFRVDCDICNYPIQPSSTRYHCFSCTSSKYPNRSPGDYDIHTNCYVTLESKNRISVENGHHGWRRCLQGHRMIVVGFDDSRGGQRRVIVNDLVGGRTLHEEPSNSLDHAGLDLQQWSWVEPPQMRLVTTHVAAVAPTSSAGLTLTTNFPPEGGAGMRALVQWSWYPKEGEGKDELLIPRGAEVREVVNVNGDWFYGVYMGAKGLFPAPYVRLMDR